VDEFPGKPDLNHEAIFDFLKKMTDRLATPIRAITRLILRVASKYVERAVLFLVKDGRAHGVAGAQRGRSHREAAAEARAISFALEDVPPFAEAVYSRGTVRISDEGEWMPGLAPGKARERALFPVLHRGEVLAVLYCDNPHTGGPLSKLTGLTLFLSQAAIALENALLHRQLQATGDGDSLDDQDPRTEELTPIVPETE
jgi:GAF domain-containing protein